tara:strand:- start:7723 stop:8463 length:741 start_codon:yes stop_codon:yes gene_type:complete
MSIEINGTFESRSDNERSLNEFNETIDDKYLYKRNKKEKDVEHKINELNLKTKLEDVKIEKKELFNADIDRAKKEDNAAQKNTTSTLSNRDPKKQVLDAKDVSMKLIDKNGKQSSASEKTEKSSFGFGNVLNSIFFGIFGSQKKQEEELRRLQAEVKSLATQQLKLENELKNSSEFSSANDAIATEKLNELRQNVNADQANTATINDLIPIPLQKENELIDQKARLNMMKSEKIDRISQLRKKGVK